MLPELFRIPSLGITIWTYGVALDAAAIGAVWLIGGLAARDHLPRRSLYCVMSLAGALAFISAQIPGILTSQERTGRWQGPHAAGSSFDAFLVMLPLSVVLMKVFRLPCWRGLDAFAPGLALAWGVARLGCLGAGCCWGRPTESWMGMHFTERAHELTGVPIGQ